MLGLGPQCYIPKFMDIGPLVPENKILRGFTIYGRGAHLGYLTNIIFFFIFLYLKAYIQNVAKNCQMVSEKSKFFNFDM